MTSHSSANVHEHDFTIRCADGKSSAINLILHEVHAFDFPVSQHTIINYYATFSNKHQTCYRGILNESSVISFLSRAHSSTSILLYHKWIRRQDNQSSNYCTLFASTGPNPWIQLYHHRLQWLNECWCSSWCWWSAYEVDASWWEWSLHLFRGYAK